MFVPTWLLVVSGLAFMSALLTSWDRGRRIEVIQEEFRTRCRLAVATVAMAQADASMDRPVMAQRRLSHALLKVMDMDSFSDVLDPSMDDADEAKEVE